MLKQRINKDNIPTRRKKQIRLSKRIQSHYRKLIQGAGRLLLSCGIVFVLLLMMFLLAKGPAYISFHAKQTEQSDLSSLYSRSVYLQADRIAADISGGSYLDTTVMGDRIELSSDSLCSWLKEYLEKTGITNVKDARLRIEGDEPFEIELTYETADATMRYMIDNSDALCIDPDRSALLSCSFKQIQIYPRVTNGEAYESFVTLYEDITVHVPADSYIRCCVIYDNGSGTDASITIDTDSLPGYRIISERNMWSFALHDNSLQVQSADKIPLDLEICGQYALKLSCIGVDRIRGYLTGELLFQNTSAAKNYELTGQLVDIGSQNNALNVILCRDTRHDPQIENELLVSGEATRMDISGVNPFPDIRMWFRENVYMAPVSLLSVMISMYGLSLNKRSRTVRSRRIRKKNSLYFE